MAINHHFLRMSTPSAKKRKITKDANKSRKLLELKQIQLELLDIYGCFAVAWHAAGELLDIYGYGGYDEGYVAGGEAKDVVEHVVRNVVGSKAVHTIFKYNPQEESEISTSGIVDDAAGDEARKATYVFFKDEELREGSENEIAKAACLSVIKNQGKIREEIEASR